jgi:hypothetical protein
MSEKQWLSDAFATCYLDYLEDDPTQPLFGD